MDNAVSGGPEEAIIAIMATSLASLHGERRVDLERLHAGLHAQALAVLRYRDAHMQSMLERTAAVVGINWRVLVDENEALEAHMSGGAFAGGPALTQALREMQSIIELWRDSASLLSYFVTVNGETRLCCDDRFVEMYMRDEQETAEINLEQTCPLFLWGRVLSPEDQQCFFTSVMHACYGRGGQGQTGELAVVSKCVTRTGQVVVSLVRFQVLFRANGMACAFSVTPLPNQFGLDTSAYQQQ